MPEVKKLSKMKAGEEGKIKNVGAAAGSLKKRLLDMGCVAGCPVKVKKLAPLGDPIEIAVKNYSLSLRKSEADCIDVEVE
jgi:Fe2+ transport system protein FeoA